MSKWEGWQKLKMDEVAPILSTALRLYGVHRPALRMTSYLHNLDSRMMEWRITCGGKPIGSIVVRPIGHGIRLSHITMRKQFDGTISKLARRRMNQIFLHVKYCVDREHQVGVYWQVRATDNNR